MKNILRTLPLLAVLTITPPPALAVDFSQWMTCLQTADSITEGVNSAAECVTNRAVDAAIDRTLDASVALLNRHGKARFGEGFQFSQSVRYSLHGGRGMQGDMDLLMPLAGSSKQGRALFLQNGVTRWTDKNGLTRNDTRFGFTQRFTAGSDLIGAAAVLQQNLEQGHERLVLGLDYAGRWGTGTLTSYLPRTGWRAGRSGYEERALGGLELGLQMAATSTIGVQLAAGRWDNRTGAGKRETRTRLGVNWQPHTWLRLTGGWSEIDGGDADTRMSTTLRIPIGGGGKTKPRWLGLGVAPSANASGDIWRKVATINRIEYAEREAVLIGARLHGASVRFMRSTYASGTNAEVEVTLDAPVARDTRIALVLLPGDGAHPAVAGVDFDDTPVEVLVPAGAIRVVAAIKLIRNPAVTETRSLRINVHSVGGKS